MSSTIVSSNSKEKIRDALDLLQQAAKDERAELREQARDGYAELKSALAEVKDRVHDGAGRVAELRDRGQERAREVAGQVDRYAHDSPWRVAALAAACGLAAGLWLNGRRDS